MFSELGQPLRERQQHPERAAAPVGSTYSFGQSLHFCTICCCYYCRLQEIHGKTPDVAMMKFSVDPSPIGRCHFGVAFKATWDGEPVAMKVCGPPLPSSPEIIELPFITAFGSSSDSEDNELLPAC